MSITRSGSMGIKTDPQLATALYPKIKDHDQISKRERQVSNSIEQKRYNYREMLYEKKMKNMANKNEKK